MKRPELSLSIFSLTIVNLLPLVGVILFNWDAAVLILLYWTENVVVGIYNILKIALVRTGSSAGQLGKLFSIPFFCLHFGGFCAVHGLFLLIFFELGDGGDFFPKDPWPAHLVFLQLLISVVKTLWQNHPEGMGWPVLALFISHGISFVQNYLGKKEYTSFTVRKLMNQPYKRIVLMHITIIAGGVPIMLMGSPLPLLCILVFLKVGMDIFLHVKEHSSESVSVV
jgi:hypothetical protein